MIVAYMTGKLIPLYKMTQKLGKHSSFHFNL